MTERERCAICCRVLMRLVEQATMAILYGDRDLYMGLSWHIGRIQTQMGLWHSPLLDEGRYKV